MYRGEYVEYYGSPTTLTQYTIGSVLPSTFNNVIQTSGLNGISGASSDSVLGPEEIVFLGSNDGQNWDTLHIETGMTAKWKNISNNYPYQVTVTVPNTTTYSRYRWIATKLAYQNFSYTTAQTSSKGIFFTELYAKTTQNTWLTVFPEGVTTPAPASSVFPIPNATPNPPSALVFVQVNDYPFSPSARVYNGQIVTYTTPQPTPTPTPEPSITPTPTPYPYVTPTPNPSSTPSPSTTPEPSVTPSPSITPEPSVTPSPSPSPTPSPSPSPTPSPNPGSTPTPMPTFTPPPTPSPTPTLTPAPTPTPSATPSPTPTLTPPPSSGNTMIYLLIGGAVIVVVLVILLIIFLSRRK